MTSQRGRLLIGAFLATVLLVFFFRGIEWGALGQALSDARFLPIVGLVLANIAAYMLSAWRWAHLLAPLGRVRYADLFSAIMVGFASGMLIPRAGELLRPWLISRRYPMATSTGFAAIVIERLIDLITIFILFGLYLFVLPRPAGQVEDRVTDLLTLGGLVTTVMAFAMLVLLYALHARTEQAAGGIERLLARAPQWMWGPLGRLVRAFSGGLAVLRTPAHHLARIGLQSIAVWLLFALGFHLNNLAFGIDLPFHATFLLLAFLLVGVVIPTPGMVGGFHAFYLLALSDVYGIDRATAAAAAITAHAFSTLPFFFIGAALLGREGLSLGRVVEVTREQKSAARS